jgi:hypothetical protein
VTTSRDPSEGSAPGEALPSFSEADREFYFRALDMQRYAVGLLVTLATAAFVFTATFIGDAALSDAQLSHAVFLFVGWVCLIFSAAAGFVILYGLAGELMSYSGICGPNINVRTRSRRFCEKTSQATAIVQLILFFLGLGLVLWFIGDFSLGR